MTPNPNKRDNLDLNKLDWYGTTMDPYLTDFRDEKFYCISQVR